MMSTSAPTVASLRYPFSKLKPGMEVIVSTDTGTRLRGRLLSKHNGSKTLKILVGKTTDLTVPYEKYEGNPTPDPLDQIHPMLANDIFKRKTLSLDDVLQDPDWLMEEKYDGERQILTYCAGGSGGLGDEYEFRVRTHDMTCVDFRASTRVVGKNTGRLATNSAKVAHLAGVPVPAEGVTVLDVELLHLDGFQRLRSIMGSLPARALELQAEHGWVYAVVFDVLWFAGKDLRMWEFQERRALLEWWYAQNKLMCERSRLLLSAVARDSEEKRWMLNDVLASGGEGVMVKHKKGTYTDTTLSGQRSSDVLKVKPFSEADVIITGFERGKGEYNQHKFGAITFAQYVQEDDLTEEMRKNVLPKTDGPHDDLVLVHMGTCSGITDEQEAAFRADPESFIGRVMEVRYQQRFSETGLMRHPNFVRLRGDKTPAECVYGRDT